MEILKMLILTRHKNESILIGKSIEIKVLKCHRKTTVIGIEAPADIPIKRSPGKKTESDTTSSGPIASTAGGKSTTGLTGIV